MPARITGFTVPGTAAANAPRNSYTLSHTVNAGDNFLVAQIITRGTAAQTALSASSVIWAGATAMTRFMTGTGSGVGGNTRIAVYYLTDPQVTAGSITVNIEGTATSMVGAVNVSGAIVAIAPVTGLDIASVAATASGTFTNDNCFLSFQTNVSAGITTSPSIAAGFRSLYASLLVGGPAVGSTYATLCGFHGFEVTMGANNKTILMRIAGTSSDNCTVKAAATHSIGGITSPTTAQWTNSFGTTRSSVAHLVAADTTHLIGFLYTLGATFATASFGGMPMNVFDSGITSEQGISPASKVARCIGLSMKNPPATTAGFVYGVDANTSGYSVVVLANIAGASVSADLTPSSAASDNNASTENLTIPATSAIIYVGAVDCSGPSQPAILPSGAVQRAILKVSATTTTGGSRMIFFSIATTGSAAIEASAASTQRMTTAFHLYQGVSGVDVVTGIPYFMLLHVG